MKVGAGRTSAWESQSSRYRSDSRPSAEAAKLPKFSVTSVSNPPTTAEPGDTFTALGVVEQRRQEGG